MAVCRCFLCFFWGARLLIVLIKRVTRKAARRGCGSLWGSCSFAPSSHPCHLALPLVHRFVSSGWLRYVFSRLQGTKQEEGPLSLCVIWFLEKQEAQSQWGTCQELLEDLLKTALPSRFFIHSRKGSSVNSTGSSSVMTAVKPRKEGPKAEVYPIKDFKLPQIYRRAPQTQTPLQRLVGVGVVLLKTYIFSLVLISSKTRNGKSLVLQKATGFAWQCPALVLYSFGKTSIWVWVKNSGT